MRADAERIKDRMRQQIDHWAAKIGVRPKRIQIQRMTTKWASCSTSGRICFSTELLAESAPFREFVIVHELLHLVVPNHGKLFKSMMNAYLPDWERRVEGRTNGICGSHELRTPIGRER